VPAPGYSFIDKLKTQNLPIRVEDSYGVCISNSGNYTRFFSATSTGLPAGSSMFINISGLMIRAINGGNNLLGSSTGLATQRITIRNCMCKDMRTTDIDGLFWINSILYSTQSARLFSGGNPRIYNCSFFATNGGPFATVGNYTNMIIRNSCVFGFASFTDNPAKVNLAQSTNLATNFTQAQVGVNINNSLYSLNPALQFNSLVDGSEDFSLLPTAQLFNAAVPDAAFTENVDVSLRPRSPTSPSIGGAEEVWYALNPVVQQSDQTIAKGIALGIERGIV
jgi:hypothetical protein